jgi:hypothetical protein
MDGYAKFKIELATTYVASKLTYTIRIHLHLNYTKCIHFQVPKYATIQYTLSIMEQ